MKQIIIDVDTGTDDATAIITAALSQDLKILAITTEWGANPLEKTTHNTLQVVELLDGNIPVYMGCPGPMSRTLYYAHEMGQHINCSIDAEGHKFSYHDDFDLPEPHQKPMDTHAVTYLIETLRQTTEPITMIMCGPLTMLGCALRIAPDIITGIDEVVIMGGGICESNITLAAEANIWRDPEAAQIVLLSGAKITMIPLDATHHAALQKKYVDRFLALDTPVGNFFSAMLERRIKVYNALQPLWAADIAPLHDALCPAYLIDPLVLEDVREVHLDICLDHGQGAGAFLIDTRYNHEPTNVRLAYSANPERFGELLYSIVSGMSAGKP